MKKLAFLFLFIIIFYSCRKKDKTIEQNPIICDLQIKMKIDFRDTLLNEINLQGIVSSNDDSLYCSLSIIGKTPTNYIYITYQKDNEKAINYSAIPINGVAYLNSNLDTINKLFTTSSTQEYTYKIPTVINNAFKTVLPFKIRKEGKPQTDKYTLWITKAGKIGDFKNPAKNLAYGIATIRLDYSGEKNFNHYETTLGNTSDSTGSYFSSTFGNNYKREKANILTIGSSIDFLYTTSKDGYVFGSVFKSTKDSSINVLDSSITKNFNKDEFKYINNVIKIAEISSSDFDAINSEASLSAIVSAKVTVLSANKVTFINADNKAFAFMTKAGKKGVVKILKATGAVGVAGQANLEIKVQR